MPLTILGRFKNRHEAGRALAAELAKKLSPLPPASSAKLKKSLKNPLKDALKDTLVVGIPRGGVPVAAFVAEALKLPLDVVLVKKLTAPGSHELAIGAVAQNSGLLVDEKSAKEYGATPSYIESERLRLTTELQKRNKAFHSPGPGVAQLPIKDKHIILVDDGMATGFTMRVAAEMLQRQGASKVTVAVPVTSQNAEELLKSITGQVIAVKHDPLLYAVGSHYSQFEPVPENDVLTLLKTNRA